MTFADYGYRIFAGFLKNLLNAPREILGATDGLTDSSCAVLRGPAEGAISRSRPKTCWKKKITI